MGAVSRGINQLGIPVCVLVKCMPMARKKKNPKAERLEFTVSKSCLPPAE